MPEPGSREWVEHQVAAYTEALPTYTRYATVLDALLRTAAKNHAPLAIVQTRVKTIPSFAEKCLRKSHKYRMPAHQLTDLCGARLITRTTNEARAVCRYLQEHLDIDWENSDDARDRLQWSEFGYRSIHYVVSLCRDVDHGAVDDDLYGILCSDEGCPGVGTFHPLKAEIQIRTLAEHAWADIAHDLSYKGGFELPATWRREIALMAAELEGVDRAVERLEEGLRTYASSYGSYLTPEQLASEMDTLETVLSLDPDSAALAQRLGKLAMTAGDWRRAIGVLERFVDPDHPERSDQPLLRDLGVSLGKRRASQDDRERGRRYLAIAIDLDPSDTDAIASLAGSWAGADDERARMLYLRAFETDPTDYYPLLNFVEFEIGRTGTTEILDVLGPLGARAMERCREHIAVGMNMPWALYSMARFQLLLGSPFEALEWYALGIRASVSGFALPRLDRTAIVADHIEGYEWARRLLLLARAGRFGDTAARDEVRTLATPGVTPIEGPVAIVVGGTDPRLEEQIRGFRPVLTAMLAGFRGTVISGGTRQGVCGMVGESSEEAGERIRAIGYLPNALPDDAEPDTRYDELRHTDGPGFSPLEPLQNWIDLAASGIDPGDVTVIGINGGRMAAAEYRIALALGARVGLVVGSGREAARLLVDERWVGPGQPVALPMDPQTVRAFVNPTAGWSDDATREILGRELHRMYRDEVAKTQRADPAQADWADLPADLRASNLAQADAMIATLEAVGCRARAATGEPAPFVLTDDEVERLAEMEHGRWNAERLVAGWRWGARRDPDAKLSPYLVPWTDLPEEIREYDRVFVRRIPTVLAMVGFEVVRVVVREVLR